MRGALPAVAAFDEIIVPDTEAVRAARAFGVDIGSLIVALRQTPLQRLERLEGLAHVRRVARPSALSVAEYLRARQAR